MSETSLERSRNYITQLKGSVLYKALAVVISFVSIPLMIDYLGHEKFGVWSTLLSIMSWIVFFDLGLGNGLRNKVAEAIAKDEISEASKYVSSAYTIIGCISLLLFLSVAASGFYINWQKVFNTHNIPEATLRATVVFSSFFVLVNFLIGLINQLLNAVQKTSAIVFGQLISNALSLFFVFFLSITTDASILYLAISYGIALILSNVALSVWFYRLHPQFVPKLLVYKQHIRPIFTLGIQFFVIQIAVLVIFTTDKIMITQLFGPMHVTHYDVIIKFFSIITIAHSLISAPLWSSYTDAYHRNDIAWVKKALSKQIAIFLCILVAVIILIPLAKPIIELWIGKSIFVSPMLVHSVAAFVVISTWNNIFGFVLGGINKIRLGSYYTVITAVLNIPVSYFFAITLGVGVPGIMLGTVFSISISAVLSPLQVYYFIYTNQKSELLSRILR